MPGSPARNEPDWMNIVSFCSCTLDRSPGSDGASVISPDEPEAVKVLAKSDSPPMILRATAPSIPPFIEVSTWMLPDMLTMAPDSAWRSEEHTSELQSQSNLVCRL